MARPNTYPRELRECDFRIIAEARHWVAKGPPKTVVRRQVSRPSQALFTSCSKLLFTNLSEINSAES